MGEFPLRWAGGIQVQNGFYGSFGQFLRLYENVFYILY